MSELTQIVALYWYFSCIHILYELFLAILIFEHLSMNRHLHKSTILFEKLV